MYDNDGLFDKAKNSLGVSCNLVHIVTLGIVSRYLKPV